MDVALHIGPSAPCIKVMFCYHVCQYLLLLMCVTVCVGYPVCDFCRFCLSSIEQQYAAENFQTLSRHHTTKSSKLCNLGNSVGKRKKDQSNVSYKRKYLDLCSFAWHDKGKMMVPEHRLTETEDVEVAAKAESLCSLDVDEETSSAFRDLHQHSLW